jgi:hypothetical protein
MEIPEPALRKLAARPDPALPMARIPQLLEEISPGSGAREGVERATLRTAARHPDLLRVVVGWRGPWRTLAPDPDTLPGDVREALTRQGMEGGVWLVPLGTPEGEGGGHPAIRRLVETVRYLGRVVDVDSPRAVTRWIRIIREAAVVSRKVPRPGEGRGAGRANSTTHPPDPPGRR